MRKLASLLASLAVALAALFGLELALRALGLGDADDHSQLRYQAVFLPVMSPDVRTDGVPILRTTDPRLPYQQVPAVKAPGTLRVYLFGGSAMAGLGFSPNVTVARHLERMLQACLPGRTVEVVNLGIVALPSKKVKLLVEDVLEHGQPDLVVVFSGNNEFLELHARKYAAAGASPGERLHRAVSDTNLFRLIRPPRPVRPEELVDLAANDARVSEDRMVQEIDVDPGELRAVQDGYQANLEAMARGARAAGVPLVLMTVAANWEWDGQLDPPADWPDEFAPGSLSTGAGGLDRRDWAAVVAALDARLAAEPDDEQAYRWLHRRALAHRALGRAEEAARDFRASMNRAPHLRRASDALAERVRAVASAEGALLVDTIAYLAAASSTGTVGFEYFYDYVHFTPRGAALTAGALLRALCGAGLVEGDCEAIVAASDAAHAEPCGPLPPEGQPDFVEVDRWLGLGLDPTRLGSRDLWKYDAARAELDERLRAEPDDWRALAYRGNAAYFRQDGGPQAERDWRRALELGGEPAALESNLARLAAQARGPAVSLEPASVRDRRTASFAGSD